MEHLKDIDCRQFTAWHWIGLIMWPVTSCRMALLLISDDTSMIEWACFGVDALILSVLASFLEWPIKSASPSS